MASRKSVVCLKSGKTRFRLVINSSAIHKPVLIHKTAKYSLVPKQDRLAVKNIVNEFKENLMKTLAKPLEVNKPCPSIIEKDQQGPPNSTA